MSQTRARTTDDGLKIAENVATDKVGFFGATPIVQPVGAAQAAATDAATAITTVNAIRTALVALGIIKGAA